MSEFTSLLMDISKEIERGDLETMKCYCSDYGIGANRLEEITKPHELFKELKRQDLLGPDKKEILVKLLEKADRFDLRKKVLKTEASSRVSHPSGISVSDAPVVNAVLRDQHLNDIAEDLGRDWKHLGRKLGISSSILDNIDEECRRVKEKAFQTMSRWKRRSGNDATEQVLATALREIGRTDIAETLAGLCQQDGINVHPSEPQNIQHSEVQENSRANSGGLDTMQADLAPNLPTQESADS